MYWETIILIISFVVFGFDIAWQFYVAGMYAPKKARSLIINDPLFSELRSRLVTLERNIGASDPGRSSFPEELSSKIDSLISDVTVLSNRLDNIKPNTPNFDVKFTELGESLRGYINGSMGKLAQGYYDEMNMLDNNALKEGETKEDKEFSKMAVDTIEKENQYNFYMNLLSPFVGEEQAEKLSKGVVFAPKYLKGVVKKKIVEIIKSYGG